MHTVTPLSRISLLLSIFFSMLMFWPTIWAQSGGEPIAWIESFEGEVLVRQNEQTLAASNDMPLQTGNIVATRAGASVVIRFENDCRLRLPEQQALDIVGAAACCDSTIPEGPIARLERVKGEVIVNRGSPQSGFEGMELFVADIVQTGEDSTTFIVYPDGCGVKLQPNQQHTLRFARECCIQGCLLPITAVVPALFGAGAATATATAAAAATTAIVTSDSNNNVLSEE